MYKNVTLQFGAELCGQIFDENVTLQFGVELCGKGMIAGVQDVIIC